MLLETHFSSFPLGIFQLGVEPGLPAWPKQFRNYCSLLHRVSTDSLTWDTGTKRIQGILGFLPQTFKKPILYVTCRTHILGFSIPLLGHLLALHCSMLVAENCWKQSKHPLTDDC